MINPQSFAIREILEVTLLIVARYIPETMKHEQRDDSTGNESIPSFVVSNRVSSQA